MAEYLICAADFKNGTIETVRMTSEAFAWKDYPRTQVLGALALRHEVWTYVKLNGELQKGARVERFRDGFLRTKTSKAMEDNLGGLPSIADAPFEVGSKHR